MMKSLQMVHLHQLNACNEASQLLKDQWELPNLTKLLAIE